MAVASGQAALSAIRALIGAAPVPAATLLHRPYLPSGLDPAPDPVLSTEQTLIGGYGNSARYALADDPAIAAAIAGPPASVLSGSPSSASDLVQRYVTTSLDLTMQGGTTSGVVYPLAVCELATRFRFRNVGGASAGAIAAAATAAAEVGRSEQARHPEPSPTNEGAGRVAPGIRADTPDPPETSEPLQTQPPRDGQVRRGFVGISDLIGWLSQARPGDPDTDLFRLAQLFRPVPRSRAGFRVGVAAMRRRAWTLPILVPLGFGWSTRLLTAALLLGAVAGTGWASNRFSQTTRSWPASVGEGLLGLSTYAAGVIALILIGQGILVRRASTREERVTAAEPGWLRRLRYVSSAPALATRRWLSPILTGLGLAAGVVALGSWRPWTFLAGVGVGLAASLLLVLLLGTAGLFVVRRFGHRGYGLIAGSSPARSRSLLDRLAGMPPSSVDHALVPWLDEVLRSLAGLPAGEVLRFGHLWAGRDYPRIRAGGSAPDPDRLDRLSRRTEERLVNLELMATDLSRQRPYRFPLSPCDLDDPAQLWLCLDQWRTEHAQVFPEPVLNVLGEGRPRQVPDRNGHQLTLHPLPAPADLPVIFAVRLSLALPVLFQAVRMYRIVPTVAVEDDFGRRVADRGTPLPPAAGPVAEELWFSDGGITSNFPVHFFDNPLPRWPTVSLNLAAHPETEPHQDIGLPRDFDPVAVRTEPLTASGVSLAGAVLTTARTWRDRMQAAMPGYRNRIAQVRTRPDEGGTNLFMPREVIASLALRGALAGVRLRTRFADPGQWDRFRWLRLRTAMSNLEQVRLTAAARRGFYADALTSPEWLCAATEQLTDVPVGTEVPWYVPPPGFWPGAADLVDGFVAAYDPGTGLDPLTTGVPRPEPVLRQVPQE